MSTIAHNPTDWTLTGLQEVPSLKTVGFTITSNDEEQLAVVSAHLDVLYTRASDVLASSILTSQAKRLLALQVISQWNVFLLPLITTGSMQLTNLLDSFDVKMSKLFLTMQGIIDERSDTFTQLNLPIRLGGLGLGFFSVLKRSTHRVTALYRVLKLHIPDDIIADISALLYTACNDLATQIKLKSTTTHVRISHLQTTTEISSELADLNTSKSLMEYALCFVHAAFISGLSPEGKDRIQSLVLPSSATILSTRPIDRYTTLSNIEIQADTCLRLNILFDIRLLNTPCHLCNRHVTYTLDNGSHGTSCTGQNNHGNAFKRHERIVHVIKELASSIYVRNENAPLFTNRTDQTKLDIYFRDQGIAVDVMVSSAIGQSPAKQLKKAEQMKITKHKDTGRRNRIKIVPCVISVLGGLGIWFRRFIQRLVTLCPRHVNRNEFRTQARQYIAVALAKGNAVCLQFALESRTLTTYLHAPTMRRVI